MWSSAPTISEGDVVIVWMTRENLQPITVTRGKELNNKYGYYRHDDFLGVPYGFKVGARNKQGFVHLLRPTPELWTLSLPHRTQILYLADIAFITSWLDLKPGARVVEAGTGSGSFSHAAARTVGPGGRLYSFEFHEARAAKAREEFARHGLGNVVLEHRNVCRDGFALEDTADAVFLDLPAPWDAVRHAKLALRKDRVARICCFSPCIEQVLRTVTALNDAGFCDVTTYESLLRPHDVSAPPVRPLGVGSVAARLKKAEEKREERRRAQIRNARARNAAAATAAATKEVEGEDLGEEGEGKEAGQKRKEVVGEGEGVLPVQKRARLDEDAAVDESGRGAASSLSTAAAAAPAEPAKQATTAQGKGKLQKGQKKAEDGEQRERMVLSKAFAEVRGHTSYLTFARLVPLHTRGAGVGGARMAEKVEVTEDVEGKEDKGQETAPVVAAEVGEVRMDVDQV